MKKSIMKVWRHLSKISTDGKVTIAVYSICEALELCEASVRNATKELNALGYVTKEETAYVDRITGKLCQGPNTYTIHVAFFNGTGSKIRDIKDFKRFKDLKDLKIKKEDEKNVTKFESSEFKKTETEKPEQSTTRSEIVQAPSVHKQVKKQPVTSAEAKELLSDKLNAYAPEVVRTVLQRFDFGMRRGTIILPLLWIQKALDNAQDLFDRKQSITSDQAAAVYDCPIHTAARSKNQRNNAPYNRKHRVQSMRPQVQLADHGDGLDISAEQLQAIREKARRYEEKDRHAAV